MGISAMSSLVSSLVLQSRKLRPENGEPMQSYIFLLLKQRTFYHPTPTPSAKFTRATEEDAVSADNVNRFHTEVTLHHTQQGPQV